MHLPRFPFIFVIFSKKRKAYPFRDNQILYTTLLIIFATENQKYPKDYRKN